MSGPGNPATVMDVDKLVARSIEVILEHQDPGGAYIAAPAYPPYAFCWFRDGAFIADAMSRAGELESAEAFFGWCSRAVEARSGRVDDLIRRHRLGEAIAPEEHLPCRLRPDGGEGDGDWPLYQLDGYGAWLWALGAHAVRRGRSVTPFLSGAEASARYVAEFWIEPCYDWWEERSGRHTVTLAAVHAGLVAAAAWPELDARLRARLETVRREIEASVRGGAVADGRLAAELGGTRLDASLLACGVPFGLLAPNDPLLVRTVHALEVELAHGGVHRHAEDSYYGGGEWLLLAALLGLWHAAVGRRNDARVQLEWIGAQAGPNGELPEQSSEHLLHSEGLQEWIQRWGPPASPLLWSHAMFLTLADELGVSRE